MSGTVHPEALKGFVVEVLRKLGVQEADARTTAEVMVASDLRGVDSHGVVMLPRKAGHMRKGLIEPGSRIDVVHEAPATLLLDGGNGLGEVVSRRAMDMCIEKARTAGAGFVAVRNSNHYGMAGYYPMMALAHDMIGISMTNTTPLVVPTFGRKAMFGTNPLSVAAPAGRERPFVLDMATSGVPSGKMTVYKNKGLKIPHGWAIDSEAQPMDDPGTVSAMLYGRSGGGLLPLGGLGELFGGHKGYGLGVMVDIFSGVLSGAAFGPFVYPNVNGQPGPGNVGHFFGALRIDAFRPAAEFKQTMDDMIRALKESPKVPAQDRIYVHGEKEFEIEEERRRSGVPLHPQVVAALKDLARDLDIAFAL